MIGKKVSSMCLDDAELNFYRWDGELSDLLGKVLASAIRAGIKCTYAEANGCTAVTHRLHLPALLTSWMGLRSQVKDELNDIADTWTDEQKAHCLDETTKSFEVRCTSLYSAVAWHQHVQAGP